MNELAYGFDNRVTFAREDVVRFYMNAKDLLPAERSIFQRIESELVNARILDIGVGGGRTTPYLLSLTDDYTGVDYVPEFVDTLQTQFSSARFVCADARTLEALDDDSYDFVLFSYNGLDCVDHLGRLEVLRSVYRVLRPGGRFMFSSHNRDYEYFNKLPWQRKIVFRPGYLIFLIHCLYHLPKHYRNKKYETYTDEYAIINDGDHRFSLLLYYISVEKQRGQLESVGFGNFEAYDQEGQRIHEDTNSHWIHYLVRKP